MTTEERLSKLFGYAHAVLFGRARGGLTALAEILAGTPGMPVLIPTNICSAVPAGLLAGAASPRLVAVSKDTGLVPDERFAAAMEGMGWHGVVMPAHLYGLLGEYPETKKAAMRSGWFVLENDTCAVTSANGAGRRAIGDALLVSFGIPKTIEAGIGGAVLTDDAALARELAARVVSWPPIGSRAEEVECHVKLARRHLRALGHPELAESLVAVESAHTRYSFPESARARLDAALDRLPETLERRWERVRLWQKVLAPFSDQILLPPQEVSVPWRLVRRLRSTGQRDGLVAALREAGFDAGTNFPPLAEEFPRLFAGQNHPDAEQWGRAVINLWLTDDYDSGRISAAGSVIEKALLGADTHGN
jgi:dTDP-4-amino-4,6-dideoxygalactose transaminase